MFIVRRLTPILTVLMTLIISITLVAQDNCPVIVQEAFREVGDACAELGRNTACYGYNNVEATFYSDIPEDFFTAVGDVAQIEDLETIGTVPLDRDNDLWGIAVLQVQANLPNTLPGQNVVFILLGDTEIVDDVPLDDELPEISPLTTTVTANTNVRSGASLRNNVVMTLTQGTEVIVDGLSADGDWARVAVDEIAGWIFADLLADDVSDLAVVGGLNNAPMQAFQMRTGFGMPDCVDAPDAVLVQGTENYEIEFVVNDAEVRIGSTALLQTISETRMQIMMLDGVGIVDDLRIPAGWKAQIDLAPDDDNVTALPQAIGTWFDCMRLDDTDLALIDSLSDVPESVLNYPITVPAYSNQPCQSPSLPVETTTNTNTSNASNASQSEIAGVDCSTFQFLGPTSNISPRPQTFTWSEASGADEYELVFFSVIDQVFAGTFRTSNTNLTVTLGEVPTGSEIQIEVRAYINGQYACVTGRTDVITLVASGSGGSSGAASGASGSFSASWECNVISATSSDVTFKWFNPPAGTTGIEMDFDITAGGNDGGVSNVGDGSRTFGPHSTVIGADDFTNGYAETIPGGDTINLPPLNCN